jgi:hypothetical protein
MIDYECRAVRGMIIGRGNRSTLRKSTPVPLSSPQIPHYLTWARTRAAAVGSGRLTAGVTVRPPVWVTGGAVTSPVICNVSPDLRGRAEGKYYADRKACLNDHFCFEVGGLWQAKTKSF